MKIEEEMLDLAPFADYQVGVDEVGRGCLWGPVYAAAVLLPEIDEENPGMWAAMKDSKLISKKKRERLAQFIRENALAYGIGIRTAAEVDRDNILQASLGAMHSALDEVWKQHTFKSIVVDGIHFTPYITPSTRFSDEPESIDAYCIAQGDASLVSIAAASILAKVARDQWVESYVQENPDLVKYSLQTNVGYGTAMHMNALKKYGVHELHRHSFRPVAEAASAAAAAVEFEGED